MNAVIKDILDLGISGVTSDSRRIRYGYCFVAIKGISLDGHNFIQDAVRAGARALVVEEGFGFSSAVEGVAVFRVKDTKALFWELFSSFYGLDLASFVSIGITGTNGKTTVSYMIEFLLSRLGIDSIIAGTINYRIGGRKVSSGTTTPGIEDFLLLLREGQRQGIRHLVMEVSSHALSQGRLGDFMFDRAVFTNLSQDHLDYHADMDDYFSAKRLLFVSHLKDEGAAIINVDDEYGRSLYAQLRRRVHCIGVGEGGECVVSDIEFREDGVNFAFSFDKKRHQCFLPMLGIHNIYNAVQAVLSVASLGYDIDRLAGFMSSFPGVPGRMEVLKVDGRTVVIDYAHTPDGLKHLLGSLRMMGVFRKIICVFGAGGDRDRAKRSLMAEAVEMFSDFAVVTSDNPRTEDPERIIDDIIAGFSERANYVIEVDRHRAIYSALDMAGEGDVVVIAGKGHEDYQIIGSEKIYFSDKRVVEEWAPSR